MWMPYEMFSSRLEEVRESLPPLGPADRPQLGVAAKSGGCLVPVAIAALAVATHLT